MNMGEICRGVFEVFAEFASFEVFTAVKIQVKFLKVVTSCSDVVESYHITTRPNLEELEYP
jgi:hypothetical protein